MSKPKERRTGLPQSWSEVYDRLDYVLGNDYDAREWIAQGLEGKFGVMDPSLLDRKRRGIGLQKASGVLLALEDVGTDVAFDLDVRTRMVELIERYFAVKVEGPPWRVTPYEDLPSHHEYVTTDF